MAGTRAAAGAQRGLVRPDAVTPLLAAVGPALVLRYSTAMGMPVPDTYVRCVVDDVLVPLYGAGAAGGPPAAPPRSR